jgi:hypothetical protein
MECSLSYVDVHARNTQNVGLSPLRLYREPPIFRGKCLLRAAAQPLLELKGTGFSPYIERGQPNQPRFAPYRWLASPASTLRLNSADRFRGMLKLRQCSQQ